MQPRAEVDRSFFGLDAPEVLGLQALKGVTLDGEAEVALPHALPNQRAHLRCSEVVEELCMGLVDLHVLHEVLLRDRGRGWGGHTTEQVVAGEYATVAIAQGLIDGRDGCDHVQRTTDPAQSNLHTGTRGLSCLQEHKAPVVGQNHRGLQGWSRVQSLPLTTAGWGQFRGRSSVFEADVRQALFRWQETQAAVFNAPPAADTAAQLLPVLFVRLSLQR